MPITRGESFYPFAQIYQSVLDWPVLHKKHHNLTTLVFLSPIPTHPNYISHWVYCINSARFQIGRCLLKTSKLAVTVLAASIVSMHEFP